MSARKQPGAHARSATHAPHRDPSRGRTPGAHTLPSEQRDFVEWHRGRPQFALWAVALADPAVDARLEQLRAALQPLLLPGYRREPHVTVQLCGFAVDRPQAADEFGPDQLQAQLAALERLRLPPFELRIGGAFSFSAAACLAVRDPSRSLRRLRAALARPGAFDPPARYVPHVTAGLYGGAWPLRAVRARLRPLTALPEITVTVSKLAWMSYATAVVGGPLCTLRRCALHGDGSGIDRTAQRRARVG